MSRKASRPIGHSGLEHMSFSEPGLYIQDIYSKEMYQLNPIYVDSFEKRGKKYIYIYVYRLYQKIS